MASIRSFSFFSIQRRIWLSPDAVPPENSGLPEVYIDVHEENGIIVADAVIVSGGTRTAGHGSARICDYVSRDRAVKTSVGSAVLEAGGKLNGTLPPWGILTGVRPAKIAAE